MEQQLAAIFRAIFDLADGADVQGIRQLSFPKWDSLAHVTLIGAVENEFGLSIDIADSLELTSFEAILVYLEEHQS
jgi:acyl carrier protein